MGLILSANTNQFISDLISPSGTTFSAGTTELLSPDGPFTIEDLRTSIALQDAITAGDVVLYSNTNKIMKVGNVGINYFETFGGVVNQDVSIDGVISATTFYGDGSNISGLNTDDYLTGGTFNKTGNTLTIDRLSGGSVTITDVKQTRLYEPDEDNIASYIEDNGDVTHVNYGIGRDDGITPYSANTYYTSGGTLQVGMARTALITNSGRFYCYTDNSWVTDSDDNYGPNYYQMNETCGTGVLPDIEWEHMGYLIPKGKYIKDLKFAGKSNNTQVTDLEVYVICRRPDPITRWDTGMDNDLEDVQDVLYSGLFKEIQHTGNMNDFMLKTIDINYLVPEDSMISIYLRPVGGITATRYYSATWTWQII